LTLTQHTCASSNLLHFVGAAKSSIPIPFFSKVEHHGNTPAGSSDETNYDEERSSGAKEGADHSHMEDDILDPAGMDVDYQHENLSNDMGFDFNADDIPERHLPELLTQMQEDE